MKEYGRRGMILAAVLSTLAGFVDAVGFLTLGGFFISFMSGNSTRMGVGLSTGRWDEAATAAGLIALFVVGVVIGGTVARRFGEHRRSAVLIAEALLLLVAATLGTLGRLGEAMIAAALAMGVENAVFQKQGDVGVGLTYMTGTLVRMGQRITTALHGGARWDWLPFLGLWLGLSAGGALGAATYLRIGVLALWPAALLVVTLAAGALALEARNPPPD